MNLAALYDDPANFLKLSVSEMFDIDYDEIAKLQLHHFRKRFHEMRAKIPALRALLEDVGQEDVTSFDDLVNVAFPHTIYKSYAISDIENSRYDRMTRWFQTLTAHDLSKLDVSDCDNLDTWLDRLEAQTPLRPGVTSGTSGKISMFPRSVPELPYFFSGVVRMLEKYKDEHMIDLFSGEVPIINVYPASTGRPGMLVLMRTLREKAYSGRTDMTITFRDRHITTQELWLSAKVRRADRLGQTLVLTPEEEELKKEMLVTPEQNEALWDRFIERIVTEQKGKAVLFFGAWIQVYQIAVACKARGVKVEWSPESVIFSGGGTKGYVFPDGWMDVIKDVFGAYYPQGFREGYAMTETTASMPSCAAGNLHPFPWGIQHVVDPETGRPLPRKGTQKGRLMVLDLLPNTYWSGTATGDGVTVNWDGGCSCGRKGPYFHNEVRRLADLRGGEDKIVHPQKADAYERLEERLSQS
jgi:hypothetical protein